MACSMNDDFNLAKYEVDVGELLQDLEKAFRASSAAAAGTNGYAAKLSYMLPEERVRVIAERLSEHEHAIRGFLARQTQNFDFIVSYGAEIDTAPAAQLAPGEAVLRDHTARCRRLLDDIANGLATVKASRQFVARSASHTNEGLNSLVEFYRKPPGSAREYYNAPHVLYETLHRLCPIDSCGASAEAPPVPNLRKGSTDRELSLTEKVLRGHGMIEVPLGESYWVLPCSEREQHPVNDHRGENFGVQRTRNDYGNSYQKPLYGGRGANIWY